LHRGSTSRGAERRVAAGLALGVLAAMAVAGSASSATDAGIAADELTAKLSDRQLAGQMIIAGYSGKHAPASLVRRIRAGEVAGVIIFSRNIGSRAALRREILRLQLIPRPGVLGLPLLVMIDQEGGQVKRLSGAPTHSPAEIGARGSAALARSEGRATGRNLRSVGVNINLAPVMDVGRAGSYQQRSGRSYSTDPAVVANLGSEFVAGLGDAGVGATLKHFPGLGVVSGNEDNTVQRVRLSANTLRAVDEVPFAEGIGAGAELVMTSTAIYPALDSRAPALFSRKIIGTELRRRQGYHGVVITDDLEVPALRRYGSISRRALLAARAGNQLLLFAQRSGSGAVAVNAIVSAMRSGRLSRAAVRAAAHDVLLLRDGFLKLA
jgi:beta-N-acetylhexosaminidase